MGYLDSAGLSHFTSWVRSRLSGKQDKLTPDASVKLQGGDIGVASPVRGVVAQAEFDALPEAERNKGFYMISDGGGGSGGGSSAGEAYSMKIVIDGQEVSLPGGSGGESAGEVYSTEETRIGTWIDGKPLYRRVYTTSSPSGKGSWAKVVSNITENIDRIITMTGAMYIGGSSTLPNAKIQAPLPYLESSTAYATLQLRADGIYMIIAHPGTAYSGRPVIIVSEYTKTTD